MALGIAFVPIVFFALGLFFSGYKAADIDIGLRVILVMAWLGYILLADRVANLRLWKRLPLLRSANVGELLTLVIFSALMSSLKLNPGMARADMTTVWIKSFAIFMLCFGAVYVLFKAFNAARARARYRRKLLHLAQEEARQQADIAKGQLRVLLPRHV